MTIHISLFAALLVAPLLASAQTSTPRVDTRQERQATRIEQGAASGALTPRETERLERGQARIDRAEDRALLDGSVSEREKVRLEHLQDQQSRQIAREKHDRQTDYNHDGRNDRNPRAAVRDDRIEARHERLSERRDESRTRRVERREHRAARQAR